ncbi:hypothetical protein [Stakelama sediminis]|nr:hypothetical protein [Stakelama sediminis]
MVRLLPVLGLIAGFPVCQPASAADALGVYNSWGTFQEAGPRRCYAIAEPVGRYRHAKPFATVSDWPASGIRDQFYIRLSRPRNPNAHVTLSVGDRRFELVAGDQDAWAPDAATDRAITGAMRSGRAMSVETVDRRGRPFTDVYALQGAATAIDAAAVACFARPGKADGG